MAIAVLLLILNWFYHRVYWQENLQGLHRRKKLILGGAGIGVLSAQALGLVALGFSSVYREGFETVLFLQALTLEAGAWTVLQGVALGFAAVVGVFLLVVALERKLPHRKMLVATGLMITWVLVVLVGQTVQTLQKVGWVPVTPVDGLVPNRPCVKAGTSDRTNDGVLACRAGRGCGSDASRAANLCLRSRTSCSWRASWISISSPLAPAAGDRIV